MQYKLDVDAPRERFRIVTEGEGTAEGIIDFLNAIVAHPRWKPGWSILLDHRKLSIKSIQVDGIEWVSGHFAGISDRLGTGKCALVMNREIDFGIARAWENVTADRTQMQISVFRTIDEAEAWLDDIGTV